MSVSAIRILAIEDDPVSAGLLQGCFNLEKSIPFQMEWALTLAAGLERLAEERFDIVLLDLTLPDSAAQETFRAVRDLATEHPVIIFSSNDDVEHAREAIRQGAQEYIVKGTINARVLVRAVIFAIERHHAQRILQNRVAKDQLTGLDNRTFFFSVAEKELEIARRRQSHHCLLLFRLTALEQLPVRLDPSCQNELLVAVAKAIQAQFRSSDLIARVDDTMFAVLALDSGRDGAGTVRERLIGRLDDFQVLGSVGISMFDPESEKTLRDLVREAQEALEWSARFTVESTVGPEAVGLALQKLLGKRYFAFRR